jgi:hypothetical protein
MAHHLRRQQLSLAPSSFVLESYVPVDWKPVLVQVGLCVGQEEGYRKGTDSMAVPGNHQGILAEAYPVLR